MNRARYPAVDHTPVDEPARPADLAAITELRALVADLFAAEISAATPRIVAALQAQPNPSTSQQDRDTPRYAAHMLSSRQEPLRALITASIFRRFSAKLESTPDAENHSGRFSRDALLLMQELGMQQEFELEKCVQQLREPCEAELFALSDRVRQVLGWVTLPESHNPIFPRVMLRALLDALEAIGCDARARYVVLRAISPLLEGILGRVYVRANAKLACAECGVQRQLGYGGYRLVTQARQPTAMSLRLA